MAWSSFAKGAGGRRAAAARSRWFVRAHAMAIAPRQPNVACGATQLPWLPVNSSRSPRARWIRLEQAEQATSPVARRGAARDRGIAFVRASAPRVSASPAVRDEKGQIQTTDWNNLPAAHHAFVGMRSLIMMVCAPKNLEVNYRE